MQSVSLKFLWNETNTVYQRETVLFIFQSAFIISLWETLNFLFFHFQILQLQMNDYKYHYLFTTFDIEMFDLEDFKYNFVNMTAFRVVDAGDLSVQEVLRDMTKFHPGPNSPTFNSTFIQVCFLLCCLLHTQIALICPLTGNNIVCKQVLLWHVNIALCCLRIYMCTALHTGAVKSNGWQNFN